VQKPAGIKFRRFYLSLAAVLALCLFCGLFLPLGSPQGRNEQIVDACRSYGFDVVIKNVRSNLGILCRVDSLFDAAELDKRVRQLILCVNNAVFHKDSAAEFCHFIIRDDRSGVENHYVHYIGDLQKRHLDFLTQGEFRDRTLFFPANNLYLLGKKRIEQFFRSLSGPQGENIAEIPPGEARKIFSKDFLAHLLESDKKSDIRYELFQFKARAVSPDRMFFFCKARHKFMPKNVFNPRAFKYTNGSIISFVISVENVSYLDVRISKVFSYDASCYTEEIPQEIKNFGNPEKWKEEDFYLEAFNLPDFIAGLTANKVSAGVSSLPALQNKKAEVRGVEGHFKSGPSKVFEFRFTANLPPCEIPFDATLTDFLNTFRAVCRDYRFDDFERVEVTFPEKAIFKSFQKKELAL
jgi:hypothetical protein